MTTETKFIVGVSGGIDSQAALNWAMDSYGAGRVIAINADPGGNEHPLTTEFLAYLSRAVCPIITCRATYRDLWVAPDYAAKRGFDPEAPVSFADMAKVRGRFPYRKAQFCTELLKLRPMRRWVDENLADVRYERVTGLRRDESDKRVHTPGREYDSFFNCYVNHPLAHWTKQQCFDLCVGKGQQVNPLYKLGFTRVGCAPCVNASRADIRNWAKRFPLMIDKVRRWEHQNGRTFYAPMVPGKDINWIDEVVEWANCERGGKQYSLDVWMPAAVCESVFGLCE